MRYLLEPFRLLARGIASVYLAVRDGEDDVQGTYPDQHRPTGEEAATQGSVTFNLLGMGH